MEIPETAQARALEKVAALGTERAELLARAKALLPAIQDASAEAAKTGALLSRIQQLSRINPNTFYGWMQKAGYTRRKGPAGP